MNESFFLSSQNWSEWFINQVDTVLDFNSMPSYNKANEKKKILVKSFNLTNATEGFPNNSMHSFEWKGYSC